MQKDEYSCIIEPMKTTLKEPQQLLEVLQTMYPDSSKRTLRNWLKGRRISIDGVIETNGSISVNKGQTVAVGKQLPPPIKEFSILFEDDHLIVIDKPIGLLSVPLDTENSTSALGILRQHFHSNQIFAVHRIDKSTSGVLVFVKSEEARLGMDLLFKKHELRREYLALVEGHLKEDKGTWSSFLKDRSHFEVMTTENEEEGRIAITHFEVLKRTAKSTWLRLILETGRKHQIRIHCRDAGHPIIGDKRYGSSINPYKRICLHAHRIVFDHPITHQRIDVKATPVNFTKEVSF